MAAELTYLDAISQAVTRATGSPAVAIVLDDLIFWSVTMF
jgi:hypothetical protein